MNFCTALAAAIAAAPNDDVRNTLLQLQYNFCNDGSAVVPSQADTSEQA